MHKILKTALVVGLLVASAGAASAAARVGFNLGNVSIGFSDGYWDNSHHWHKWAHRGDVDRFRAERADAYHEWRHNDPRHRNDHY